MSDTGTLNQQDLKAILDNYIRRDSSSDQAQPGLAELRQLEQEERERNKLREIANIAGDTARVMAGAAPTQALSLDDTARQNLMKVLAAKQTDTFGEKDKFRAAVERFKQESIDRRHEQGLERRDRSLVQGDVRLGQAQQKIEQPSEKAASDIAALRDVQKQLDEIKSLKENVNTGAITDVVNSFLGKWVSGDIPSKDRTKLKTRVTNTLAGYIKSISGAAVTDSEAKRLSDSIPKMDDDDEVFNDTLVEFQEILNETLENKLNALEATGRDVSKFRESGKMPSLKESEKANKELAETWEDDEFLYRRLPDGRVQKKRK